MYQVRKVSKEEALSDIPLEVATKFRVSASHQEPESDAEMKKMQQDKQLNAQDLEEQSEKTLAQLLRAVDTGELHKCVVPQGEWMFRVLCFEI